MYHRIHASHGTFDGSRIAHVRDFQVGAERLAIIGGMDVRSQRVQYQNFVAAIR